MVLKLRILLLVGVTVLATASAVFSSPNELPLVRVSPQPCMHALPTILATNFGWGDEIGIRVSFHYFVSGQ
jgi:hypothetical protein